MIVSQRPRRQNKKSATDQSLGKESAGIDYHLGRRHTACLLRSRWQPALDRKPDIQRAHDGGNRFETRLGTRRKCLVETFPAKTGRFRDLRHAARFGHVTKRLEQYARVFVADCERKIFRNRFLTIEIVNDLEWRVSPRIRRHSQPVVKCGLPPPRKVNADRFAIVGR